MSDLKWSEITSDKLFALSKSKPFAFLRLRHEYDWIFANIELKLPNASNERLEDMSWTVLLKSIEHSLENAISLREGTRYFLTESINFNE